MDPNSTNVYITLLPTILGLNITILFLFLVPLMFYFIMVITSITDMFMPMATSF